MPPTRLPVRPASFAAPPPRSGPAARPPPRRHALCRCPSVVAFVVVVRAALRGAPRPTAPRTRAFETCTDRTARRSSRSSAVPPRPRLAGCSAPSRLARERSCRTRSAKTAAGRSGSYQWTRTTCPRASGWMSGAMAGRSNSAEPAPAGRPSHTSIGTHCDRRRRTLSHTDARSCAAGSAKWPPRRGRAIEAAPPPQYCARTEKKATTRGCYPGLLLCAHTIRWRSACSVCRTRRPSRISRWCGVVHYGERRERAA